jgi:acyl-CoA thioesterase FadM
MICTEAVVGQQPVVIRRRVKWGECDPAGVVYTPEFADYVISAAELFYGELLGMPPQEAKRAHGFGTPTRALSFDFRRSLRPDDIFVMTVIVEDLRDRTYVLNIVARTPNDEIIFIATLTPVCVSRDERTSIPIPEEFRLRLLRYRDACGVPSLSSIARLK